jgi:hypothetical protein
VLDRESPSYALDVVSIVEATVDDPKQVLARQQTLARDEAIAAMKAEGMEYEQRMELLEDITYPKPLSELLDAAYSRYRQGHPWVADYRLSPKSVVRDMYERAMTFTEYVGYYGLARSEGVLLRYLADAYDALRRTVPDDAKTEPLHEVIEWLGELVRQVDSSLLDEWEALRHPGEAPVDDRAAASEGPAPVTRNERAFRVLVRNEMFRRVRLAARGDYERLGALDGASGWDAGAWEDALAGYFAEYDEIGTGPDARGPGLLLIDSEPGVWRVRQIFDDPEGDHDWGISAEVDLPASDEAGSAVVRVTGVDQL